MTTAEARRQTGFWPADAAAGVAGAAIGTAGAIATAPFRGDSNAYYNNGNRGWSQSYAERNGFVCQPGTWFRGEDGRRHHLPVNGSVDVCEKGGREAVFFVPARPQKNLSTAGPLRASLVFDRPNDQRISSVPDPFNSPV